MQIILITTAVFAVAAEGARLPNGQLGTNGDQKPGLDNHVAAEGARLPNGQLGKNGYQMPGLDNHVAAEGARLPKGQLGTNVGVRPGLDNHYFSQDIEDWINIQRTNSAVRRDIIVRSSPFETTKVCITNGGDECKFPFTSFHRSRGGETYEDCTKDGGYKTAWCHTDSDGNWDYCKSCKDVMPLPRGWEERNDHGQYYFNLNTGKTQRERPTSTIVKCPQDHPFAFYDGQYCCATNKEKPLTFKPNAQFDPKCIGSTIYIDSSCCENDAKVKCPSDLCTNDY